MSTIQPHSWCHVGDDNLTRVMLRSVNTPSETPIHAYAQHKYHECIGYDMT
jgi:hypothetical protein